MSDEPRAPGTHLVQFRIIVRNMLPEALASIHRELVGDRGVRHGRALLRGIEAVAGLLDGPSERESPEENTVGTRPRNAPNRPASPRYLSV